MSLTQVVFRPLRHWPWLLHFHHHHHPTSSTKFSALYHHLLLPTSSPQESIKIRSFSLSASRGKLRRADSPLPTAPEEEEEDAAIKSRNQLKREAKRAVKWGMDLSSFSPPQIKRILRVVSLDQIVFEALMLVKRMGPDVREGRRRQFNYIGKLLRNVEPELMDRLIKATKDSDHKELQALTGLGPDDPEDDSENLVETEDEKDDEESKPYDDSQVTRWFDGLINKDIQITNEVYSVQGVEYDRQELRKLVRKVHFAQETKATDEDEEKKIEKAEIRAKKALTRFLRSLSENIVDEH
ncbi:putative ribosome-associated, YjgA, PSPTO4464-like domain-containing protein [Medicago truncatula]|uniref:DUF615 family protein n=1 Tax=Medicago truncatula TaxID=3880 RepID=I3SP28_MEDTR|nr:UPF0307 protein PMI3641 [Medicago truncatula]AFK42020.1 unknown [Medicago truncatula]KEH44336.1 DUF615 family protein [Medicago truncatula]RHN82532.1 putative ribosome-associated, YjgA, PSPTO4464-like domain-containing protein [Medicago truncatula]